MNCVRWELVERHCITRDGQSFTRNLVWRIGEHAEQQVRRMLIDGESGETLDDLWLDYAGRLRSYMAPQHAPEPACPSPVYPNMPIEDTVAFMSSSRR